MSQQLVKKESNGKYSKVMPFTWIEAVKDKITGKSLTSILRDFNMYYVSYSNSKESTRLLIPQSIRKKGLYITYVEGNNVYTEYYLSDNISDEYWQNTTNWKSTNLDSILQSMNDNVIVGNPNTLNTIIYGNLVVKGNDGIQRVITFNTDGSCSWRRVDEIYV